MSQNTSIPGCQEGAKIANFLISAYCNYKKVDAIKLGDMRDL